MAPLDIAVSAPMGGTRARLTDLRRAMAVCGLDTYLVPSTDEHLNEYLPEVKKRRAWMSSFTGSAGDLLVDREGCWLFVDSRYYEQAEREIDLTSITLCKLGLEGEPSLVEVLERLSRERAGLRLGYHPALLSLETFRILERRLTPFAISLEPIAENLVDRVRATAPWSVVDPPLPWAGLPVVALGETETGESVEARLTRVREALRRTGADLLPVVKLDQVAWLYNLRGQDVPYNPVFLAYGLVSATEAFLFTEPSRLETVCDGRVQVLAYEDYLPTLAALVARTPGGAVLVDPARTTLATMAALGRCRLVEVTHPVETLKARKNSTELDGMRRANLKASRAKIRALQQIGEQIARGQPLSETEAARMIEERYAEESGFVGLSFETIAALGENASIAHYTSLSPDRIAGSGELLLIDSGAHFRGGTTDDTRTISTGNPTPLQIERYTEVLRAHINGAMQIFPKGTGGSQLDGITRASLWLAGLEYGHGTGHGVGAFLNVHEGPHRLDRRSSVALEPGMITSIEPGFYEPGWGGIRIENLYIVVEVSARAGGPWYAFEPLTYLPFDRSLIDLDRLESRQRLWLERYHSTVIEKLAPLLDSAEADWLRTACRTEGSVNPGRWPAGSGGR